MKCKRNFYSFLIFVTSAWFYSACRIQPEHETDLLIQAVRALSDGLGYMEEKMSEINIDGVFGCRFVEEHLYTFLKSSEELFYSFEDKFRHEIERLQRKSNHIATNAIPYIKKGDPDYYEKLGAVLEPSDFLPWYASKKTKTVLQESPVPCAESVYNGELFDLCFQEVLGKGKRKLQKCGLSKKCLKKMTLPRKRGYYLTHQVLYLQFLEKNGCLMKTNYFDIQKYEELQEYLCANVMRDSEEISRKNFPVMSRDLFMEQIGLCGMWGYADFYKREWLENILQWQDPSGCYNQYTKWSCSDNNVTGKIRSRRNEKQHGDGCLSHQTSVALLALSMNIRFCAEDIFERMKEENYRI